ncbi:MAG: hypothetical protein KGZ81_07170 [Flavobacteriales bacterium]|nr:hypothetical protein [Flavobacteriales bacterium]
MLEILNSVLDVLTWLVALPSQVPPTVWALLASSLGVSVILQGIKKKFQLSSPKVILTLATIFSFAAAGLEVFVLSATNDPNLLGQYTTVTLGISTILYRFAVQPATSFLGEVKDFQEAKKLGTVATPAVVAEPVVDTPKQLPIADEFEG